MKIPWPGTGGKALLIANSVLELAVGAFAAYTVVRSASMPGGIDSIGSFAAYYGVRGTVIAVVLIVALWAAPRDFIIATLVIAGLVQLADIPVGFLTGSAVVWIGATLIALLHLFTAGWLRAQAAATTASTASP